MDVEAITGGEPKYIGGVLSLLYFLLVIVITLSLCYRFAVHNTRLNTTEMANVQHRHSLTNSFQLNLRIYVSRLPSMANSTNAAPELGDLCAQSYQFRLQNYFKSARNKS